MSQTPSDNVNEVVNQMQQLSLPPFEMTGDFSRPFIVTQEILDANSIAQEKPNHRPKQKKRKSRRFEEPDDLKEASLFLKRILYTRKCTYKAQCGICFEETQNLPVKITPCGHVYHCKCLTPWTHENLKRTCPSCRSELFPNIPQFDDAGYIFEPYEDGILIHPPTPPVGPLAWTPEQIAELERLQTEIANMQSSYNVLSSIDRSAIIIRDQNDPSIPRQTDGALRMDHSMRIEPPLEQPEILVDRTIASDHRVTAVRVDSWHFDVSGWENTISIDGVMAWEDGLRDAYIAAARTLIRLEMERHGEMLGNVQPINQNTESEPHEMEEAEEGDISINEDDSFEEN